MSYNFKNLVFEGGGIKGFSYCGVIKELESKNMLKNFNKFAGTSSGSIFASLLAAEFTADEILEIQNLELNIFKFSSYFFSFYNLWFNYGLFSTKQIEIKFRKFLSKRVNPDITLKELFNKTGNELVIVSCCINRKSAIYFHHKTFPNVKLIDAIISSISIPIFFKPKISNYFGTEDNYIDGGVVDNYPIWIFNDIQKLYENKIIEIDKKQLSNETLGIKTLTKNESNTFLVNNKRESIKNIFKLISDIIETLILQIERSDISSEYIEQTIAVKEDNISSINFGISKEDITSLIKAGQNAVKNYFVK